MATNTPIATVSSVTGEVNVRDSEGQLHQLKVGDQLNEGDVVIPSNGGSVELTMADGRPMTLNEQVEVTLSQDMLSDESSAVREDAITDESIAAVLEALEAGVDPTDVLPEPAAGAAETGGEGHDFIRLARIVETLSTNDFPSDAAAAAGAQELISPDLLNQEANDAPGISVTANDFIEDAGAVAGDAAGTFVTLDPEGNAFTVTFTTGTNSNGHYVLANGQIELTQAGVDVINAGEALDPIDLTVTLNSDPSLFGTGSDTPVVTSVNDAPSITVTANDFIEDTGALAGDVAGTYVTADAEGDTVTVTFTAGTNSSGHYVLANGQVELTQAGVDAINAGDALDSIDLTVTQDNDPSLFGTGSDTPVVTSVNDAPSITVTANDFTEDAGAVAGDVAGTYVTADEEGDAVTVTFTPGTNSSGHFVLVNGQVELTQAGADAINAGEPLDPIDLTVTQNSDPSLFGTDSDTPVVSSVDDAPTIDVTANDFVEDAGAVAGDMAGTYVTADAEGDAVTVSYTTVSDHYVLNNGQVELTQAGMEAINAGEALDPIDLTVTQDNDPSLFGIGSDTPVVTPVNDAPSITVTANDFTEDTGAIAGDVAGTFVTADAEGDAVTVSYTTVSDHYVLNNGQVELTQAGVEAINAGEALDPIDLTVTQDNDPSLFGIGSDTPVVTPVNDAPSITVTANDFTEDSGAAAGDVAGTFVTADAEGDAVTVSYTTVSDHYVLNNGQVELTQTGVDAINAGEALDPIDLTVTQDNDQSLFGIGSDTPVVTPVNDAPSITVTANDFTEDSGAAAGDVAGTYVTADAEGDAVTVSFTAGTNSSGHYVLANGQVELTQAGVDAINAGEALDPIDLTVTQDNDPSLFGTDSDTPVVTSVDDAPTIDVTANDFVEDAGAVAGDVAGTYVTADAEGDAVTVSFTTASDHYILNNGQVELTQAGVDAINAGDALDPIDLTVTQDNDPSLFGTDSDTPVVTSVDDAPTIDVTANDFVEDAGAVAGDVAGTYVTADAEGDAVTVSFTTASDHYILNNGQVELTQAGVDAINAGEALDPIDLTVTQDNNPSLFGTDSDTPVVSSVDDAPTIDVTANDFVEDAGAVAGDVAGTYVTADAEDDAVTVTFTTASDHYILNNGQVELTQAGVDAINAGDALDPIDLTVTQDNNPSLFGTDSDTPVVSSVDDAPSIDVTANDFVEDAGAVAGDVAGTYVTADAEDDAVTVTFTAGTNSSGHYVLANAQVELTPAGVAAINAGDALDLIDLTVTQDNNPSLFGTDSDTPVVTPVDEPVTLDMANSGGIVYDVGLLSVSDSSESTSGSFKVNAPDGLASVTIAGSTLLVAGLINATELAPLEVFSNDNEELVITGYDATSGTISYSYTLVQPVAHAEGSNQATASFQITATDLDASVSAPGFLVITQNDDIPEILSVTDGMGLNGVAEIVGALNVDPSADAPQGFNWGDVSTSVNLYANDEPVIITTDEETRSVTGMLTDETMVFTLTLNEDLSSYTYQQYMPIQTEATEALIAQNLSGGNSSSFRLSSSGLEADPIQTVFYGYEYDDDLNAFVRSTVNTSANNMGVGTGQDVDSDSGEQDQLFMSFDQKVTSISLKVDISGNSTAELRYTVYSVQPDGLADLGEDGFIYPSLPEGDFSDSVIVSDGDTVEFDAASLGLDEFTFIVFEADAGEYKLVPSELTVNYLSESQDFSLSAPFTVTDSDLDSATDSIDIDISGTLASLTGNEFDNALGGDEQENTLIGGQGDDVLTGALESDTFAWNLNDGGSEGSPAVDVISDFDVGLPASGGDILDLSELLVGEEGGDLTHYLHFDSDGSDSVLHVSSSGGFTDGNYNEAAVDQVIEFSNIILDVTDQAALIHDLVDSGKLITD